MPDYQNVTLHNSSMAEQHSSSNRTDLKFQNVQTSRDGEDASTYISNRRTGPDSSMKLNAAFDAGGFVTFEWTTGASHARSMSWVTNDACVPGASDYYTLWRRDVRTEDLRCVHEAELADISAASVGLCARFSGNRSAPIRLTQISVNLSVQCIHPAQMEFFILPCNGRQSSALNCSLGEPSLPLQAALDQRDGLCRFRQVSNRARVAYLSGCIIGDRFLFTYTALAHFPKFALICRAL